MIAGLDALRPRLRGLMLLPGDAAYDDARSLWNAMIDRRPAAIARCLGTADVLACVDHARRHGLALAVKGGGHNIAGLAVADDALVIDLSLMRGVWIDTGLRTAHAQAGCLLGDVDRETQLHGLAAVLGFVSTTGIAGLTLGGGFGYLTRRFGWGSDNVLSMELVTSDARLLRASEREHADLFWGLRGGGGNFGVVTAFEYRLHLVGPDVVAGLIAWRADGARDVLRLARTFVDEGPPELVCAPILRRAPAAPWLPKEVHGEPIVMLVVCDTGPLAEAERRVARVKALDTPVGDVVERRSYVSQQSIVDATQPKGRRYYWKSEYLARLDDALLDEAIAQAAKLVSASSSILLFPLGGALAQLPADHSAVGNRDASWALTIMASWEDPREDAQNIGWARDAWSALRCFSTGGTYVNFLTEEEGSDRIEAAYGANHDRLVDLKTAWDPDNLFRCNKNIAPRSAALPS
jgi:FAD/FMN-containing dehydrogenase